MAAIIWLILMVVFLFVEGTSVSIVSLWFAAGALAALIVSLIGGEIWLQILVFLTVSIVLLAALRPLVRKYIKPKLVATNVDSVIGSTGIVTAAIDNIAAQGQVKIASMEWTARSTSGDPIPVETQVRVDRIEGVKVFVSPVQVESPV